MLIQQQQDFIQQLSSGTVIIDSAVADSSEEDKEPVLGDLVKVTKWKWEFIEADFPTMVRYVKDLFRRGK